MKGFIHKKKKNIIITNKTYIIFVNDMISGKKKLFL